MMPNFPRRPNIGNEAMGFGNQPSGQFRQNALAGLGSPQSSTTGPGGPADGGFGTYLQGLGYAGPLRGTEEFRDARQAGDSPYMDFTQAYRADNPGAHPWMDWRQSQGFAPWNGWLPGNGGFGGPGGPGHGELPHFPGMPGGGYNSGIVPPHMNPSPVPGGPGMHHWGPGSGLAPPVGNPTTLGWGDERRPNPIGPRR